MNPHAPQLKVPLPSATQCGSKTLVCAAFVLLIGAAAGCGPKPDADTRSYKEKLEESLKSAPIEDVVKTYRNEQGEVVDLLFYNTPLSPQLAEQFNKYPQAQTISFQECRNVSPAVFKGLGTLPELTTINIMITPVADADVAELAVVKGLRKLKIANGDMTGATLDRLAGLPLEELDLTGTQIDTAGANLAGTIPSLKVLKIHSPLVKVAELSNLADHASLTELNVTGCDLAGDWIALMGRVPALTYLYFDAQTIDDPALARLAALPKLHNLNLTGSKVTNDGLAVLPQMAKLESLTLTDCANLTDAGLQHVAQISSLTHLDLRESPITPDGLQALHGMKQLQRLYMHQVQMRGNNTALPAIREALPDCEVVVTEDLAL